MGSKMPASYWRAYRARNRIRIREQERARRRAPEVRKARHQQEARRLQRRRAEREARVICPWTGHEFLALAVQLVPMSSWDPDLSEDLRSEAVLAMLEGRDPQQAVRAERARHKAWEAVTTFLAPEY